MLATRVRRCPLARETVTRGMALAWPRTSNLEGILSLFFWVWGSNRIDKGGFLGVLAWLNWKEEEGRED